MASRHDAAPATIGLNIRLPQAEHAARRVANLVGRERQLDQKRMDFEGSADGLKHWIDEKTSFYRKKEIGDTGALRSARNMP